MTISRKQLKQKIEAVQQQPMTRRLYVPTLKLEIVDYTMRQREQGTPMKQVARDLGLSYIRLIYWVRHVKRCHQRGLVPFEARTPAPSYRVAPMSEGSKKSSEAVRKVKKEEEGCPLPR